MFTHCNHEDHHCFCSYSNLDARFQHARSPCRKTSSHHRRRHPTISPRPRASRKRLLQRRRQHHERTNVRRRGLLVRLLQQPTLHHPRRGTARRAPLLIHQRRRSHPSGRLHLRLPLHGSPILCHAGLHPRGRRYLCLSRWCGFDYQ